VCSSDLVEKPIALSSTDAKKLKELADKNKCTLMVGMHNRFRDDVQILRNFIKQGELGEIFYVKSGWLQRWEKWNTSWRSEAKSSGGGVLIDLGLQLIDLAFYITNFPKLKKVRLHNYNLNPNHDVEDAALAVIETEGGQTITIEVSWNMHLEKDTLYTNIFGKEGSAKLDPLRIHKEMHGSLVNVSPMQQNTKDDVFKRAYRKELKHFVRVIKGEEENNSSCDDAIKILTILEALYESAKRGEEISLS